MAYKVLFNTLDNDQAGRLFRELTEIGHICLEAKNGMDQCRDGIDLLILCIPKGKERTDSQQTKTIREELDQELLLDELSEKVNSVLQTAREAIPYMRQGSLRRLALLTDGTSSIRESREETDYAFHMSQAAANMIMKILFNTYRPEGFTFRCYAEDDGIRGIGALEYLLTEQSYIESDDYIHSDENRLVLRDGYLRELSW